MKYNITALILFLFLFGNTNAQDFKLQNGDLIFQDSGVSSFEKSIQEVTKSLDGYQFTHVGMVYIDDNDSVFVLEATTPKLVLTPINEYLYTKASNGTTPRSVVARLKEEYQPLIPEALEIGFTHLGTTYDYGFVLGNDNYYCSELVYETLKLANDGKEVFHLAPMTFKDSQTGQTSAGWTQFFDKHQKPVPEGALGISPGSMSLADVVDIVYRY